ncbi:DNA-binding protein [Dyadobacter endophyticus]|uniref:DNA-binding protein n=1 Tax=Dyadobacter endophyticus TaxID=1749036 RepID=A0ABQ1YMF5_9BACT|nr:XRE family transcriptional regulator [Dyadobacter endophyticus]GGH29500.1 DNA-binding protein [Dyadobacter endophyticus]
MADKAYITPIVFRWARESAKMTSEIAASKVNVTVERLLEWEAGTTQPTIKQAQMLAKAYKRPFALFFLPDIPRDFQPLQDFRRSDSKALSTGSVFMIREIQQKQAWISETNQENREQKFPFVGRFTVNDNPEDVAEDILNTLDISPGKYPNGNAVKEWIEKAEAKGIFVSRTSFVNSHLTLDSDELQGFAIADPFAPFVFINSEDWAAPQLFTLVHELAHIWIAASGISADIDPGFRKIDRLHPVELFCNEVAANALIPKHMLLQLGSSIYQTASQIFAVAKTFGVSSFALLVRALNLNLISIAQYKNLKAAADAEFKAFLIREEEKKAKQKESTGGPSYYLLQIQKNSRLFTQTVLDAFHGGSLEPTQASSLLNVKINHFHNLEAQLYK